MSIFPATIQEKQDSEVEKIATQILEQIKHCPATAMEIGNLLIEYAERDIAEAMREEVGIS